MTSGERMPFQLTFRSSDPYESRLHQALRLLPRGYAKLVFLRVMRGVVPPGASVERMRRLMEELVTEPVTGIKGGGRGEGREGGGAGAVSAGPAAGQQGSPTDSLSY